MSHNTSTVPTSIELIADGRSPCSCSTDEPPEAISLCNWFFPSDYVHIIIGVGKVSSN